MKNKKIIIGLDLSITSTGFYIINGEKISKKDRGLIKTKKPKIKTPQLELERLLGIIDKIEDFLIIDKIDLIVIEGIAMMITNTQSLIQLSALNYFVRKLCYDYCTKFIVVAPTTLKKFVTGKGNAKKDQMLLETYKKYNISFNDDNICDAHGLAEIGRALLYPVKLTKPQHEVVDLLKKQL